jgi:hypothetical protein
MTDNPMFYEGDLYYDSQGRITGCSLPWEKMHPEMRALVPWLAPQASASPDTPSSAATPEDPADPHRA